jgi:predicted DCC family thiol-disulfide oxidoreductase YuxK
MMMIDQASRPARPKRKPEPGRVGYDPTLTGLSHGAPVMVYDGACNLCHGWVRFALKRDRAERLRFLAAQSPLGQEFLKRNRLPAQTFDSFYLVENAIILHKSKGFLSMVQYLRWPWPWLAVFGILPTHPLDRLYDWIAQNRYRWFGRRELCLVADEAKAERFL